MGPPVGSVATATALLAPRSAAGAGVVGWIGASRRGVGSAARVVPRRWRVGRQMLRCTAWDNRGHCTAPAVERSVSLPTLSAFLGLQAAAAVSGSATGGGAVPVAGRWAGSHPTQPAPACLHSFETHLACSLTASTSAGSARMSILSRGWPLDGRLGSGGSSVALLRCSVWKSSRENRSRSTVGPGFWCSPGRAFHGDPARLPYGRPGTFQQRKCGVPPCPPSSLTSTNRSTPAPLALRSATMCRRTVVALAALCLALCVSAQQKDLSEGLTRCLLTPEMLAR